MDRRKSICLLAAILLICMIITACSDNTPDASDTTINPTANTTAQLNSEETTAPTDTTVQSQETTEPPYTRPVAPVVSYDDIPAFSGGMIKTKYDCGDGVYMLHISNVMSVEFDSYITKLEGAGFAKSFENDINGNKFREYKDQSGRFSIYTYYAPYDKSARVIVSPITSAVQRAEYTGEKTDILFTQMQIKEVTAMSYVVRTAENSFIIIDGGLAGYNGAKDIYNLMCSQRTGTEKPVIAAWILTHPHADHIGVISEFASLYYDKVVLERIVYNFVSDETMLKSDSKDYITNAASYYNNFRNALNSERKWIRTEIIKPHTGQKLVIGGVELEFLYTQEDTAPDAEALMYMNAASLAFTVKGGTKKAMIFADSSAKNMTIIAERYKTALKCDILQATHHGRTHGNITTYNYVDADICFWCTTTASFEEYKPQAYNQWLLANVKTHYISADGVVTLNFSE